MPSSPNRMLSSALPPSRSSMRWTSVLRAMAGHPLLLGSENYSSDLKRKPCFEREWIGPGAIVLGTTSLPAVATPRHSRSWRRGTWRGRHSSMTASPSPRSSTGRRLACSDDRCGTLWVPRRPGAAGPRTGRQPPGDRPWRHRAGHGACRRIDDVFADLRPGPASWHTAADPHVPALPPLLHTTSLERLYEAICHGPAVRSWPFVYRPWP